MVNILLKQSVYRVSTNFEHLLFIYGKWMKHVFLLCPPGGAVRGGVCTVERDPRRHPENNGKAFFWPMTCKINHTFWKLIDWSLKVKCSVMMKKHNSKGYAFYRECLYSRFCRKARINWCPYPSVFMAIDLIDVISLHHVFVIMPLLICYICHSTEWSSYLAHQYGQ